MTMLIRCTLTTLKSVIYMEIEEILLSGEISGFAQNVNDGLHRCVVPLLQGSDRGRAAQRAKQAAAAGANRG